MSPAPKILDCLASIPVFGDHPEILSSAMRCIDEAIQLEPQTITFKGTKASLLIEQRSVDDGIAMLKEVEIHSQSETDQGICSFYLAYALSKSGNQAGASEQLRLSKEKYPRCLVAAKIERKMEAA